jgi:hypothetical protein
MATSEIKLKSIEPRYDLDVGVLHDVHFFTQDGQWSLTLEVQFLGELKEMKWEALTAHLIGLAAKKLNANR